eukprot:1709642-Pyramimonas_sp.AAC.1
MDKGGKDMDVDEGGRHRVQELQLMEVMATPTIQLDVERAIQSRAQYFVLVGKADSELLLEMGWTIEQYDKSGVVARQDAKDKGEELMGNPFGKKP